jgi:putative ABC transport system permease protein
MRFIPTASLGEGLGAVTINPLRTILSTLGVVMGIASVIATLALADGFEQYVRAGIAARTDLQSVTVESRTVELRDGFRFPNHLYPTFDMRDAVDLRAFLGGSAEVTMSVVGEAVVNTPTSPAHAATMIATLANFLHFGNRDVLAGRYFTDAEVTHNVPVIVLSNRLATDFTATGNAAAMVGRSVRVRGRAMSVVGVMPPFTGETNYQIYIPLRGAAAALGIRDGVTPALVARAPSVERVDATRQEVVDWIATRYRGWERAVTVTTSLAQLEQVQAALGVMRLVLGALAGIALLVGGVGIMNVLLASVAERTREIGVRKALGARRVDILCQFLAESVAIAGMGTGVGTVIGLAAAFGVAAVVRWHIPHAELQAAVTVPTIVIAVSSAVGIGLVFGIFPAMRAARLSPIDAIRCE